LWSAPEKEQTASHFSRPVYHKIRCGARANVRLLQNHDEIPAVNTSGININAAGSIEHTVTHRYPFLVVSGKADVYPGVAIFLQNACIFFR